VVREAGGRTVAAGTVTDERLAKIAVDAGARILIAPNLDQAVMAFAAANQVPMLPGVLTPTELAGAARLGAGAVKVFPASVVGPGHFSALRPVFPDMQLVATGGLDAGNARDFIAAGVSAVAFGSLVAGVIARPGLIKELPEQITAPWRPLPPGRAVGPGDPAGNLGEGNQAE
jgi:2-dehydro-3-deoxyphosphogluconate aldolase / (4S)-4-hydroxy-2-oxoglutarate aldolase